MASSNIFDAWVLPMAALLAVVVLGSVLCTWIGYLYGAQVLGWFLSVGWGIAIGTDVSRSIYRSRRG
jgi:hypothetical protein